MSPFRIGTRGSRLALWQATFVADRLRAVAPSRTIEIVEIETAGDQVRDVPLPTLGGEGVFTKEIQRALLGGTVDVAVHSLKDLPTTPVAGLTLAAVPPRGPAGDVFVSQRFRRFDDLPQRAVVATGSLRRQSQALYRRPDLQLVNIRGNVETRLRKLADDALDALILARAGLERLGLTQAITEILDQEWMLPAVGQGALGLECRADDLQTIAIVSKLDDFASRFAVLAERALLRALGGGCQVPIGAVASLEAERLVLRATVLAPDGSKRIESRHEGEPAAAEAVGEQLAQRLIELGAGRLLARDRA